MPYHSSAFPQPPRKRPLTKIFLLLSIISLSWLYWSSTQTLNAQSPVVTSALDSTTTSDDATKTPQTISEKSETVVPNPIDTTKLVEAINNIISKNPKLTIGVSYVNLDSNTQLNFGETGRFVAASTTKVVTAVDFLSQVEKGIYSINQLVDGTKASYQLQQLINQSNNDSWYAFIDLMSYRQIETFAHSIGLTSYDFTGDNLITPADEAVLLEKLYLGNLLNADHTKLLLSYMQHTNDELLIPAALPTGTNFYHKYGEILDNYDEHLGYYLHDAAIIEINSQRFVLTIYTSSTSAVNKTSQVNAIHEITTTVTDFIQTNY